MIPGKEGVGASGEEGVEEGVSAPYSSSSSFPLILRSATRPPDWWMLSTKAGTGRSGFDFLQISKRRVMGGSRK